LKCRSNGAVPGMRLKHVKPGMRLKHVKPGMRLTHAVPGIWLTHVVPRTNEMLRQGRGGLTRHFFASDVLIMENPPKLNVLAIGKSYVSSWVRQS
jgi:hypothetical protein